MIAKKPERTVEDFIGGAKADGIRTGSTKPNKNWLIQVPYDVWLNTKTTALQNDIKLPDYIIQAVKEKNASFKK
jgi:hypothetical protein